METDIRDIPKEAGRKMKIDISLFDGNNCNNFEDLNVSMLYLHDINPVPASREFSFVI